MGQDTGHNIYDVDPDSGLPRDRKHVSSLPPIVCVGCGDDIAHGAARIVTVQQAGHVISVTAHEGHQQAARANTLEDKAWQRDASHYAG